MTKKNEYIHALPPVAKNKLIAWLKATSPSPEFNSRDAVMIALGFGYGYKQAKDEIP